MVNESKTDRLARLLAYACQYRDLQNRFTHYIQDLDEMVSEFEDSILSIIPKQDNDRENEDSGKSFVVGFSPVTVAISGAPFDENPLLSNAKQMIVTIDSFRCGARHLKFSNSVESLSNFSRAAFPIFRNSLGDGAPTPAAAKQDKGEDDE